jgi:hypothetical protein
MRLGRPSKEERKQERARSLVFGKAKSFGEHAEQGELLWRDVPHAVKFQRTRGTP